MMRKPLAAAVAAVFVLGSAAAAAQTKAEAMTADSKVKTQAMATKAGDKVPASDRKFMENAAQGGIKEVKFGELASQKASDDAVKQFGQRMVHDHSDANQKLQALAQQKGVNLPDKMKSSDQRTYDKLSKMSGEQFDGAYMDDMVKDHQHDVNAFQKEADSAKDQDVKQFAQNTLPVLKEHLRIAQATQKQIRERMASGKGTTSASAGAPPMASPSPAATGTPGSASAKGGQTKGRAGAETARTQ